MHIALTYTRLRTEERLLLDAFESIGVEITPIDLRAEIFDPANPGRWAAFDAVVDRSVSLTNTLTAVRILEGMGIRCINTLGTIETCADKLATSIALINAGIPTPQIRVATTQKSGLAAIEELGYPAVLKPTVGSWGRLIARVNDTDAAEALLEHRSVLGSPAQSIVYAQEHIDKPGEDIRVFVVGGEPIAAITRRSTHWKTNTALGAIAEGIEITDELSDLSTRAARAVGADVVAVDLFECPRRGLLVNELNHSMEFRNSIAATGVDIPQRVACHIAEIAEQAQADRGALA
jgi:[lysine-biosynthesis-protein LysW]---L-2-aminoadipate ligase